MFFLSSNDIIGQKKKIVIGNTKNHFLYGCAQFSIDTFVNIGMSICPQISIVYSSFEGAGVIFGKVHFQLFLLPEPLSIIMISHIFCCTYEVCTWEC